MAVTGIIAEFNPLHRGHRYLLEQVKKDRPGQEILVVMSGDFLQRGEPALTDRTRRTAMALEAGADMVVELPPAFATGSAEVFARGAVALLAACGCVDELAFGASVSDPAALERAAALSEQASESELFRDLMRNGLSYSAALRAALHAVGPEEAALLGDPNNLLAAEYIKAIRRQGAAMKPGPTARRGASHASTELPEEGFASAAAIRRALENGAAPADLARYLAPGTAEKLDYLIFPDDISAALAAVLSRLDRGGKAALTPFADVSPELAARILARAPYTARFSELAAAVSGRNYTPARVRRCLLHILLGIRTEDQASGPRLIRILGLKENASLPALVKENASLPVVTKTADADPRLTEECRTAHRLYAQTVYFRTGLLLPDDYRQSPLVAKREKDCFLR